MRFGVGKKSSMKYREIAFFKNRDRESRFWASQFDMVHVRIIIKTCVNFQFPNECQTRIQQKFVSIFQQYPLNRAETEKITIPKFA
jgi:hypothetical protein